MTNLTIKNIGELVYFTENGKIERINDATLSIKEGRVSAINTGDDALTDVNTDDEIVDAGGGLVTPGLVDSHTHLIFAGSREDEFRRRIEGESYQSIAKGGGGILSTVRSVRESDVEELVEISKPRLDTMLAYGTTTVEVKSGYGLDTENELKMLKVAHILSEEHPIDVVPTFLGAHAIPEEYQERREDYVSLIVEEMIPAVAEQGYARFCDVFCDEGAFSVDEMRRILSSAREYNLGLKAHLDEFKSLGGVEVACELGATSVDHLTKSGISEIETIAGSNTVATLLPATTFHLGSTDYANAREFLSRGCEVALASDFNPGSAFCESLQSSFIIASSYMRMLPEEIIRSMTINGAKALGIDVSRGLLSVETPADLLIWNSPTLDYVIYHWGINQVRSVVKDGVFIEGRKLFENYGVFS